MSLSSTPAIDLNHPSLNTPIPLADPDRPYLQHGLEYDAEGQVRIKPEIEAKMRPKEIKRARALIAAERLSEANAIVGCGHIYKPLSQCPDNHEVVAARVVCDKPLLHEECARGRRRASKFTCAHPRLAEFLFGHRFEVLTFTIPGDQWTRAAQEDIRTIFNTFMQLLTALVGDGHGWMRSVSFGAADGMVEGRIIHYHKKGLPGWPVLNKLWQQVAPPGSTLSVDIFDGRDGNTQERGFLYALSGFDNYWDSIRPGDELRLSLEFRDYNLTNLYGEFRGLSTQNPLVPSCIKCGECSKQHISALHLPLLPEGELGTTFKRIVTPTYPIKLWRGQGRWALEHLHIIESPPN
jgi:hypothetical protein